ncbi:DNA topoisomerase IV subunit B [Ponticoccus sp. SC2-23]|uniref:DNA topoisomerase IV subunit B n=1 Tax=Alexandriicola marinus TaxID=2081710 RepID=UPI000FD97881|nr:DNA topoisomerase IV subunit B [Alexandriicola marinus]MBM1219642.1 DNA topoisomerase IV subunit B [Ponticoccus sp. SC6-9]MBM1223286.1 DNA topoisomerase IV subunit B [Ponticoccus sp. SC6-15]MBM1229455.1 DNA topoisomerase IV subunit B [Ponticoccus sp. SC6-38]MBM1232252.1 DNA topoisomerase IV subunit B [Ponticoccus sp. SC6-45]MBM1237798.1 DNA topoisomerase IV subunit B [Ponticoccus sp. SC6-49]MBM1241263.1 DNA topoisomerase IV subunit B [Ponticoccus sp. SC2-64]MBM1245776.1 DNA topoisomerase 
MADDLLTGSDPTDYDASSIEILEGLEPVRKRPGMYIGGTDERALHHLVAEVLDNSMDEAVAGHASRIEVELHDDYAVTIRDNGRGIPIDPHPKFPEKSALEVILCTLHAGGKFSGKAYQTSGGLHGVGASVVNALSDSMVVQVARNKELHEQRFSRGIPLGPIEKVGQAPNRRGTTTTFHPDEQIFGHHRFKPARLLKMVRSKAYLFSGVEIRWKSAIDDGETPTEATFHFPGGLSDYLGETLGSASTYSEKPFAGTVDFNEKFGQPGKVEWAINWTPSRDGFIQSYCNTVPTPEGGTHETGFWNAILKGIRAYGELVGNRKAANITRDDLATGGCALVSCFIREPEFVGQTKDRLATAEAQRMVQQAVADHFDNWLAADTKSAGAILDFLVLRAEERLRRKQEKETARKSATKKLRLPGKLVDCSATSREGTELFIVEGDSAGGSAKMARDRKTQALLPLRGKILNVLGAASSKLGSNAEISDLTQALGCGLGTRFNIDDLRYEKIIIMTDADVDGAHIAALLMTFFFTQMRPLIDQGHLYLACPPLYRLTQGAKRVYCLDEAERDAWFEKGLGGKGKIDVSRFKGLGEMDAKDLKDTTMNPDTRKLIRVTIGDDMPGETADLVERLMGKKPELRFQYIQENARFVEELDV